MSDHLPEHPRRPIAAPHLPNNSISQLRQPHMPRNEWAPPYDGRSVQARRQSRWVITGMSVALAALIVAMVRFAATGIEEQRQEERAAYAQVTALPELPDSLASFPPLKKAAASIPETAPYTSVEAPAPAGTTATFYDVDGQWTLDLTVGSAEVLDEGTVRALYGSSLAEEYVPPTADEVDIRIPVTFTAHGGSEISLVNFLPTLKAPDGRLWLEDIIAATGSGSSAVGPLSDGETYQTQYVFRLPRADLPQARLEMWHVAYRSDQTHSSLFWLIDPEGM